MNVEFWLENWKKNKIGFHQQEINSHLISFWQHLNAAPSCRVFVPLCGKSLDLLWLCQQGHSVLGVEISEIAVRDFFSENKLNHISTKKNGFFCCEAERLMILQGDFFNLNPDHVQDVEYVFDRASLIALPIELRQQYAQRLKDLLPNKTKILLVTFEYEQSKMAGPPFSVTETEIQTLYQDKYQIEMLLNQDVLGNYPQFQALGLDNLQEQVYVLTPH